MRALFLCSRNRLRSPTAEQVFSSWPGVETDSAGLALDAVTPLELEQIKWAEVLFVNGAKAQGETDEEIWPVFEREENCLPGHPRWIRVHGPGIDRFIAEGGRIHAVSAWEGDGSLPMLCNHVSLTASSHFDAV